MCRSVSRTLTNIYDGDFLSKKLSSQMFNKVLKYVSGVAPPAIHFKLLVSLLVSISRHQPPEVF